MEVQQEKPEELGLSIRRRETFMTEKVIENNQVTIMGEIVSEFTYSHEI